MLRRHISRFLVLGAGNTAATYLVLVGLLLLLPTAFAYAIAFVLGVAINTVFTGSFVFGSSPARRNRLAYGGWLFLTFCFGLLALKLAEAVHLTTVLLAAVPPLVTSPLGFLGARLLLANTGTTKESVNP